MNVKSSGNFIIIIVNKMKPILRRKKSRRFCSNVKLNEQAKTKCLFDKTESLANCGVFLILLDLR